MICGGRFGNGILGYFAVIARYWEARMSYLDVLSFANASWQTHSLISASLLSAPVSAVLADACDRTSMAGLACVSQSSSRDSCCGSTRSP